ncbi:MAG: tetratricopeptide repeat protein [Deferrisomatales bacterium]|nr:tetratricopeptide repeat protein [Deferrisomatales bacterium]
MERALTDFDRLFDSLVGEAPSVGAPEPVPVPGALAAIGDLERKVNRAVALFHRGDYARCHALLQACGDDVLRDPRGQAFQAASRAMVNGRFREGVDACVQAIRGAFYIPDLYCALGVLLLRAGERAKAHAAFQRGLRLDPRHPGLRARVRDMGERRAPVLVFLARSHPANRFLGRLRTILRSR